MAHRVPREPRAHRDGVVEGVGQATRVRVASRIHFWEMLAWHGLCPSARSKVDDEPHISVALIRSPLLVRARKIVPFTERRQLARIAGFEQQETLSAVARRRRAAREAVVGDDRGVLVIAGLRVEVGV